MKKSEAVQRIVELLLGRNPVGGLAPRASAILAIIVIALWQVANLPNPQPTFDIDYVRLQTAIEVALRRDKTQNSNTNTIAAAQKYLPSPAPDGKTSPLPTSEASQSRAPTDKAAQRACIVFWAIVFGLLALTGILWWFNVNERWREEMACKIALQLLAEDISHKTTAAIIQREINGRLNRERFGNILTSISRLEIITQIVREYRATDSPALPFEVREIITKLPLGIERRVNFVTIGNSN